MIQVWKPKWELSSGLNKRTSLTGKAEYIYQGKQLYLSLDKNVKKNARCMFNFRILPSKGRFTQDTSPFPQKNNVEVWPEHFCCLLNNNDQGGVGGGVTMVPNSQGGSPVCKKEQNS